MKFFVFTACCIALAVGSLGEHRRDRLLRPRLRRQTVWVVTQNGTSTGTSSGSSSGSRETATATQTGKRSSTALGTKWCGDGDTASNYNDLGYFKELDKCCRAHDHCPVSVPAHSSRYGVKNRYPVTMSSCECNKKLEKCLKKVGGFYASLVRKLFSNTVGTKCLRKSDHGNYSINDKFWSWVLG